MVKTSVLLIQSYTGAIIIFIILLLVAAVIGYLTAWFYAGSVYKPVIRGLEADREELGKDVAGLKEDLRKLNARIDALNAQAEKLEGELAARDLELEGIKSGKK